MASFHAVPTKMPSWAFGRLSKFLLFISVLSANSTSIAAPRGCASLLEGLNAGLAVLHGLHPQAPRKSITQKINLMLPEARLLGALKQNNLESERLFYVVDFEDNVYFTRNAPSSASNEQLLVDGSLGGEKLQFAAKQAGEVVYKSESKEYEYLASYKPFDLSQEEMAAMESATKGAVRFNHEKTNFAKLISCSDVLGDQQKGKHFVLNALLTNLGFNTGAYLVQSPERFVDPEKRDLLLADYASTTTSTLFKSSIGLVTTKSGLSYLSRLGIRGATSGVNILIQGVVIHQLLEDDPKSGRSDNERTHRIMAYTAGYTLFSLFKGDLVDGTILKRLPNIYFNQCLKNSKLKLFVSPGLFRLSESFGSTVIFYVGRKATIGE